MKYAVVIERGPTSFGAYVLDLPGCIAAAETREEVMRLIQEAIAFHIDGLREDGQPVPPPSSALGPPASSSISEVLGPLGAVYDPSGRRQSAMLSIPMDPEIEEHLEALGAKTDDSKARLAREKLLDALREDREDREWVRIAEERLARPEKTCSIEEVSRALDLTV